MTDHLFSPLSLRDVESPNRLMVSPMCQYSCEARDGLATDWHLVHLGSRAAGGAGIVMAEATAVEPRGRISPEDLGLWSQEHAETLASVAAFVSAQGSVPGIQLAHAGRKASTARPWEGGAPLTHEEGGWDVVAPSDRPYPYPNAEPPTTRGLDREGIADVVDAFRQAAAYADDAGFELVEIHAAHGYLIHEFLSPVANRRDDEYGGSFENRTRLLREVADAIREVWPAGKPLFVRISGTDWLADRESWTVEQSARLAGDLAAHGVDLVDVSSGGIHPAQRLPWSGPSYQLALAEQVKAESGGDVLVGTVGGITAPEQADAHVRNGRADLAIVGREFLRDPYFAIRAAQTLDRTDEVRIPPQYLRGF